MDKKNKGFTLAELLVVVAIIAVLVAISIPIFTSQLHKAQVATDQANLRAYYAEIQADYMTTGEKNPKVPVDWHSNKDYDYKNIVFLDGQTIHLQAGQCAVSYVDGEGYSIEYACNEGHSDCHLSLPVK